MHHSCEASLEKAPRGLQWGLGVSNHELNTSYYKRTSLPHPPE